MNGVVYLLIYLLILFVFFKSRNIKSFVALSLFPIFVSLIEIYLGGIVFDQRTCITIFLTLVWIFGFYFYSLRVKTLKSQLYWSLWALFIYAVTVLDLHSAIFWVSTGAGILYLLFQSQYDDRALKTWMLISFTADVLYLVFSPTYFSTGNHLLVSAESVVYLDIFLKFFIPMSLGMKIAGFHKSLVDTRRDEFLCTVEIIFLSALLLFKYSSGFLLTRDDWYIVTMFFIFIACLVYLRAFFNKTASAQSLLSLFMLNACMYVGLVSIFDFRPVLLIFSLSLILLQRYLFKVKNLHNYSPLLSLVFLPTLMLLGIQAQDTYFQIALFLTSLLHLLWVYNEKVAAGRSHAF